MSIHVNQAEFWSSRYNNGLTGWDLGTISTPIKEYIDQLSDKSMRILIPGCGYGHEAVYLIQKGFSNVHVLDFSPEPLAELAKTELGENISLHCADIFQFEGEYDLILEQTLFCAIDPARREEYVKKISYLLKPGGKFAGVLFDREFDAGPPFGGSRSEYKELFEKYFSDLMLETCYNSIEPRRDTEVFFIARK